VIVASRVTGTADKSSVAVLRLAGSSWLGWAVGGKSLLPGVRPALPMCSAPTLPVVRAHYVDDPPVLASLAATQDLLQLLRMDLERLSDPGTIAVQVSSRR
jgi:hypothetical protein